MRYWAYFAAKVAIAAAALYGLIVVLNRAWPSPPRVLPRFYSYRLTRIPRRVPGRTDTAPEGAGQGVAGSVVSILAPDGPGAPAQMLPADSGNPLPAQAGVRPPRFGYDLGYTLAVMAWFLLCTGVAYAIVWDQRYRCRVCLRRLRMPIETGSWSRMLQFGRPRIEYICAYGHGTLKEDELQISGLENPEWTPHSDDLWEELCASSKEPGERP